MMLAICNPHTAMEHGDELRRMGFVVQIDPCCPRTTAKRPWWAFWRPKGGGPCVFFVEAPAGCWAPGVNARY